MHNAFMKTVVLHLLMENYGPNCFFSVRAYDLSLVAVLALTFAEHHAVNNHVIDKMMSVY